MASNLPPALRRAEKEQPVPLRERLALSLAESARLTGLSTGKLRLMVRGGQLRAFRAGRRVLVRLADLEQALFGK